MLEYRSGPLVEAPPTNARQRLVERGTTVRRTAAPDAWDIAVATRDPAALVAFDTTEKFDGLDGRRAVGGRAWEVA